MEFYSYKSNPHLHLNYMALGLFDTRLIGGALILCLSCIQPAHSETGVPDAFVANNFEDLSQTWINDGSGYYSEGQTIMPSMFADDVALGDMDNDGDLDAFIANRYGPDFVFINDGTGVFIDNSQLLGSDSSSGVALGDLDGDGDLDAFVAGGSETENVPNRVWFNDGLAYFTDSGQLLGNAHSHAVSLGDLDSDGDLDAFVANEIEMSHVWINDGLGVFTSSGQELGNPFGYGDTIDVALGDIDGDGDLDALAINSNLSPHRIWLNDSLGNFVDSGQQITNEFGAAIALGDVDEDSDLDALIANFSGSSGSRVWINDGVGNLVNSEQILGISRANDVALGDLDGDGDLDAFLANSDYVIPMDPDSLPNQIFFNDGTGVFSDSGQLLGNSSSHAVALGYLSGVAEVMNVSIDIKPGVASNLVNTLSRGKISVAILGSAIFDVTSVDLATVLFGPSGAKPIFPVSGQLNDVNKDGIIDLISYYRIQETGISAGDKEACASGVTSNAVRFKGCDAVKTVPPRL